jgi:NTP pyrophosphatase (non-canonical NTP hydrolase)
VGVDRLEWEMRKTAEECCELATVLIQQLNKPHKDLEDEIIEELGDVIFRIEQFKKHYDHDKVTKRVLRKIVKEESRNANSK